MINQLIIRKKIKIKIEVNKLKRNTVFEYPILNQGKIKTIVTILPHLLIFIATDIIKKCTLNLRNNF